MKMLSTMHCARMSPAKRRNRQGEIFQKPRCVLDYNEGKAGVDLSDQQASGHRSDGNFVKWYKNVFLYVSIVNVYLVRKMLGGEKLRLVNFKKRIIQEFLGTLTLPKYRHRGRVRLSDADRLKETSYLRPIPLTAKKVNPTKRCSSIYLLANVK